MSAVLSILVPTFNRGGALHRLLESAERAGAYADRSRVELVVADNGSGDQTPAVIDHWRQRAGIRGHRQPENVGVERNIATLLAMATGRFVWFFGDDDMLADDVLEWLLPLLDRGQSDMFIVPAARSDRPQDNTAAAFGIAEPWRAPLRRMLERFGLFGVLGGLGHPVFLRSGLSHVERFMSFGTLYLHTFSLAASFHDRLAEMLPRTAFLTPVFDPPSYGEYVRRWKAEPVDHPMGLVRATLELHRLGAIGDDAPPSFFKRFFNEPWPIRYMAYHELARRIFFEVWRPNEGEWAELTRFFALLRDERYAAVFAEIRQAYDELEEKRRRMAALAENPPALGFGPL
jgi:glycosyltransferase involved in cell wall biosynthesis